MAVVKSYDCVKASYCILIFSPCILLLCKKHNIEDIKQDPFSTYV